MSVCWMETTAGYELAHPKRILTELIISTKW